MLLVTGTSGFIGKHLLSNLITSYGSENIIALTSKPIFDCPFLLHNNYEFGNDYFLENGFENISIVIHAGAFTPKNKPTTNDADLCLSNITSTLRLINALPLSVKKLIYLSAVDVYSNEEVINEQTKILPASLYGHSKYYCENMLTSWGKTNDVQIQVLRIGHVYGPGEENYDKIIPKTMRNILSNKRPEIWGNGNETRSFIYIDDVIATILKALEMEYDPGPINITSSNPISISDLVGQILKISRSNLQIEYINKVSLSESVSFDNSKMKYFLGEESIAIEEGLKEEWNHMSALKESVK